MAVKVVLVGSDRRMKARFPLHVRPGDRVGCFLVWSVVSLVLQMAADRHALMYVETEGDRHMLLPLRQT